MNIYFENDEEMQRLNRRLAGLRSDMLSKAINPALKRAASSLRSHTADVIREKYDISKEALRSEKNVNISYSFDNGVQAYVSFAGHKIPLYRYGGTSPQSPTVNSSAWTRAVIDGWKSVHPSMPAAAHQLQGTAPTRFENAFVAQMKSGHKGIFERTGAQTSGGRDQIRELMGSSIPQMLGNEEVAERLAVLASEKFEERLDHEITRLMNGW